MRELTREKETALEIVCDRENTIAKFRSFVNQVCLLRVFKFCFIFFPKDSCTLVIRGQCCGSGLIGSFFYNSDPPYRPWVSYDQK
jgi:hypothetical protein